MAIFPLFLTTVVVVHNQAPTIEEILTKLTFEMSNLTMDYEIVIVDNGSIDNTVQTLKNLAGVGRIPNFQVYALTKEVDRHTASWAGVENALGDFVCVFDPANDDIHFLRTMLDKAVTGCDVVFATNSRKSKHRVSYRLANYVFNVTYRYFSGIHLTKEAPNFRLLSRNVVNFLLQHTQPSLTYKHLPATAGFPRANLLYSAVTLGSPDRGFWDAVELGTRLIISTTRAPMRIVTALSLFGAMANLLYSVYVVFIGIFKTNIQPGWISLSLQQSGMFFLISLVLLVLGEYILHMASLSSEGPRYHIAQEFTSSHITRHARLNVVEEKALNHNESKINS